MGAAREILDILVPGEEEIAEELYEKLQELEECWWTPFLLSLLSGLISVVYLFSFVLFPVKPFHILIPSAFSSFEAFIAGVLLGGAAFWFLWFRRRYKQRVAAIRTFLQDPVATAAVANFRRIEPEQIEEAEAQISRLLAFSLRLRKYGPIMGWHLRRLFPSSVSK